MGSRPSSQRSSNDQSNGSVGSEAERELRTQNAKLQEKIAELERLQVPENVYQENEKLRQENEFLKQQLSENCRSISADGISCPQTDSKDNLSQRDNKSSIDLSFYSQTEDIAKDAKSEKSESDLNGNFLEKEKLNVSPSLSPSVSPSVSPAVSPVVPKKEKKPRRINPNSIPQRISDIDAYGQGLPLPDAELLRKNIRSSRLRKQRNDSGNSTGSSAGLSTGSVRSERAPSSSPERTDQRDVFVGVETLSPGVDESDSRSGSEAKEDLLM
ncbi:hypothetical protein HOLleu_37921 [Holothuria leucospilota]|uniref:Uncharacterized protein n=1 Tax=Holothuria leucospilota TaxID=206669 RepID=A0A9Q0YHY9_HOLLE|nr:hypothetical protein HOLleu_37921 [Holothuria leucospilota]